MKCLKPISITRPGMPDKAMSLQKGYVPLSYGNVMVPCGKCIACMQRRQNDYAFRIRAEAEKRGSLVFMTLTYANESLPLSSTMWRVSKESGEMERVSDPEFVCYSRREDFYGYRNEMAQIKATRFPRYIDNVVFEDDEYQYVSRITPTVCRRDVQLWLKRCRIYFERKLNKHLDFSYSICSEYGEHYCRPHYHVCLMGCTFEDANIMASLWSFGFYRVDQVNRVNPDGSDGFSKCASYIAKYVSKGDFKCDSEKDCTAFQCRQMNSKALGDSVVEKITPYVLAFDCVGKYDIDTFFMPDKKRYLNREELSTLVYEIPRRLAVNYDGKVFYAIPRVIRNKIFYVKKESKESKAIYCRPSRLWRMVVDHIQSVNAELDSRKFAELLSNKSPRKGAEAVASFIIESENFARYSDDVGKENYKARLADSVF